MKYNKNNKLRLFEICAGYGSQALALRRLREIYPDFDYELVGWAEFDPFDLINPKDPDSHRPIDEQPAVIAHNALHPEAKGKNYGDIIKDNVTLQNGNSPCTGSGSDFCFSLFLLSICISPTFFTSPS